MISDTRRQSRYIERLLKSDEKSLDPPTLTLLVRHVSGGVLHCCIIAACLSNPVFSHCSFITHSMDGSSNFI